MARKKSKADILRNEKYMDDAVFSAFLNLHRAAKRKSEYIWSTQKFNSFDSIWGEPVELENDKMLDDPSKVSENPKYESKILEQQYCGIDNKQNTYEVHGSNPVDVMLDNAGKIGLHPEQTRNVPESLLQNFGNINEAKRKNSNHSSPANQVLNDAKYEWGQGISQTKQNFRDTGSLKTEVDSKYIFADAEKTSRLTSFENCMLNVASNSEKNEDVKAHNGETEFKTNCIKSKLNYSDKPRREKAIESVKKKRHVSSSVNSLFPEKKYLSVENQKHDTVDKRSVVLKYLQLKIFKGDKVFDYTLELSDFKRMKKRFPKLEEVLPEIDGEEKELNYSADAVKIVLGFLRNLRYPPPDDARTAVEVLAASRSWEINQFHDEFKQKFLQNLNRNNVYLAYGAAVHYGLKEISDAYRCALSEDLPSNDRPYRSRKCSLSVSIYIEPREFCISSSISTSTLNDHFDRDIKNEIIFKALTGSYVIRGFHILLNIDNENETDLTNLEFFYVVRNFKSSYEEELKVRKLLRQNIIIHFKRNLVVNQGETAEIVVESSIKPYLCSAIQEKNLVGRCGESQFSLNVTSTYKVENSNEKRFLIGKLLYYPKTYGFQS